MNNKKIVFTLALMLLAIIGISGFFFYDLNEKSNELVKINESLGSEINSIKKNQDIVIKNNEESEKLKNDFTIKGANTLNQAQLLLEELYKKGWINSEAGKIIVQEIDFLQYKVSNMIKEVKVSNNLTMIKSNEESLLAFNDFLENSKANIIKAESDFYSKEQYGQSEAANASLVYYELMTEPLVKIKSFNKEAPILKCEGSYQDRVEMINMLKTLFDSYINLTKEYEDTGWLTKKEKDDLIEIFSKEKDSIKSMSYLEKLLLINKTDYSLVHSCESIKEIKESTQKGKATIDTFFIGLKQVIPQIKSLTLKYCEQKGEVKCKEVNKEIFMTYFEKYRIEHAKGMSSDTKIVPINLEAIVNQVIENKEKTVSNSTADSLVIKNKTYQDLNQRRNK